MKIKYLNTNKDYRKTRIYKTTKMMLILSMSALIGSGCIKEKNDKVVHSIEIEKTAELADETNVLEEYTLIESEETISEKEFNRIFDNKIQ